VEAPPAALTGGTRESGCRRLRSVPLSFFGVRALGWKVYIDEAGDRGISREATGHFVASAIIVRDDLHSAAITEVASLRAALRRHPGHVIHFQRLGHSQRVKAAQDLATSSVAAVTNVILCKRGFDQPDPAGDLAYITNPDPMYLWGMRLLLERVSWYIRDHGGGASIVTFAHVRRFRARKLHEYRRALELSPTNIHWPSFNGHPFRIDSPRRIELLQFADVAASALFRAVEPDEYGNLARRYIREVVPKLYRYGNARLTSYGLKVFPTSSCDNGSQLRWLGDL
jgi:Protein of unknown function (DUF3800)